MPEYDTINFDPPAPVVQVDLRSPESGVVVRGVELLLDSGADITLLPQNAVAQLDVPLDSGQHYELMGFDGRRSSARGIILDMLLLGKTFRGLYLLTEDIHPQGFGDFRWTRFMPQYTEADQLKLLDEAMTVWKDAIGHRPRVFRPGNFSGSPTIFPTLLRAGLVAGSVSLPGRVRKGYFADWVGFPSGAQFLPKEVDRAEAFLELPVTASRKHIRRNGGRQEPLHLRVEARSIDLDMFREIIYEHLATPRVDPSLPRILVLWTHNTPDYAEARMAERLRDLIQAIRDRAQQLSLRFVNTSMLELRKTLFWRNRKRRS